MAIRPQYHLLSCPTTLRYRRLGRRKLGNGKKPKFRTSPKNAPSPSRPVHLRRTRTSYFPKETGAQREYTANGRRISRTQQWRWAFRPSRGAPWFPITMIHPLVAG